MGGGPACFLAGNFSPGGLILMSAFTSIRATAGDKFGILKYMLSERFDNIKLIRKAYMPTFILHGVNDTVVGI